MTANAMDSARQLCLDAGMSDHVPKPIEPDVLFQTLLKWVRPMPAATMVQAPQQSLAAVEDIPSIDGLDIAGGLRRVRGKKAFYATLLRRFAEDQNAAVAAIRTDLLQGQRSEAQRRAHTLKSLAASIGMQSISRQAEQLETHIRSGQDDDALQQPLQALERDLHAFLLELAHKLPPVAQLATPGDAPNAKALAVACGTLARLLAEDNLEAVDWLTDNEALLNAALGEAYFPIADAVRRFDCALALSLLRIAAQSQATTTSHFTGKP
jgi:HPt (histidine-containing phosphotransfer) domain-containing protein